jgi:hypothetical protein
MATTASRPAALHALLERLAAYGGSAGADKAAALDTLAAAPVRSAHDVRHLQRAASFLRAFPDDETVRRRAEALAGILGPAIDRLSARERRRLDDSGLPGTITRYRFVASAARWLSTRGGRDVDIDWRALEAPELLGATVAPLLDPLEDEVTEFTGRGFRTWLERAKADSGTSDLAWLLAQWPRRPGPAAAFQRDYDLADVPLVWRLPTARGSLPEAVLRGPVTMRTGLRRPAADTIAAVREPLDRLRHLDPPEARRLLDVWRQALWSRARTIFQVEHPDLRACYVADLGEGLRMAMVGVPPERRSPLEVTYGYLLLANGLPMGYGGFTTLFAQVNTGVNVFPEFRGSEAAFAWQQALRVMRAVTGCARVVINPYQFGAGNSEALQSGAYWFHYRLGFRSADDAIRRLADREARRLARSRGARIPLATLRKLASCDLRLDLEADAADRYVEESLLETLGRGITGVLARQGTTGRQAAMMRLTQRVAAVLGADGWSPAERQGLARLAPIVAQVPDLDAWSADERRALAALCRVRTAADERPFIQRLRDHGRFRRALIAAAARRQNVPNVMPAASTATSASSGPTTDTMNMSK